MQTKTYFANSVPAALEVARQELGPEAMLVTSRPTPEHRSEEHTSELQSRQYLYTLSLHDALPICCGIHAAEPVLPVAQRDSRGNQSHFTGSDSVICRPRLILQTAFRRLWKSRVRSLGRKRCL